MIRWTSVIHAYQFSISLYSKLHTVFCIRNDISICICYIYCNIGKWFSVCCNLLIICWSFQLGSSSCCRYTWLSDCIRDLLTVAVICNCRNSSVCIRYIPCQIQVLVCCWVFISAFIDLIGISRVCCLLRKYLLSKRSLCITCLLYTSPSPRD